MNTKVRPRKTRVYRSLLRDERATQTKERILDGLVQVMARNGIADLSTLKTLRDLIAARPRAKD